ncbi:PAS domain-containing protein, partial [Teichococcus vastitatis]|uniref:PAS domain-containing protein n=1 Tax=Teichococcus vastitatis TaxID=2307076 RepID=UPI001EE48278
MNLVHSEDQRGVETTWAEATRSGAPLDMEFRFRHADGSYHWVRSRAAPRHDTQGRILRWYGTLEDVHERKLAEVALRESEEHYRYTVELSPQ